VLRPGFEPGISGSKGQNACPDYTTGARAITKMMGEFINYCRGLGELESQNAAKHQPHEEGDLGDHPHHRLEKAPDPAHREGKQLEEVVHQLAQQGERCVKSKYTREVGEVDGYQAEADEGGYELVQLSGRVAHDRPKHQALTEKDEQGPQDPLDHIPTLFSLIVFKKGWLDEESKGFLLWRLRYISAGARSSAWPEHQAHNLGVVGSNPSGPT
jgi:hypothetical protein